MHGIEAQCLPAWVVTLSGCSSCNTTHCNAAPLQRVELKRHARSSPSGRTGQRQAPTAWPRMAENCSERENKSKSRVPRPPFATSRDPRRPPAKLMHTAWSCVRVPKQSKMSKPSCGRSHTTGNASTGTEYRTLNLGSTNTAEDGPMEGRAGGPNILAH